MYLCIAKDAREIFEIADSQYFRVLVAVRCYLCKGVAIWVQQLCKTHNRVQQCPRHNTIIATTIAGNAERYGGGMPFDKAEIALGYTLLKP